MSASFESPLASALTAFLAFKHARGYRYQRAAFMLRSFDRFLSSSVRQGRPGRVDAAMLAWLASRPDRKAISVSMELSVIREFWRYLHRQDPRRFAREPRWPRLPTTPRFVAHVLAPAHVRLLLQLVDRLDRPRFRGALYRALILVLYCTGLRFGEALRLRRRDVDLPRRVLYVAESKGRSRWVPFHPSLAPRDRAIPARATDLRRSGAPAPEDRLFVGSDRTRLPVTTASDTLRRCTGGRASSRFAVASVRALRPAPHLRRASTHPLVPRGGGASRPPPLALRLPRARRLARDRNLPHRHAGAPHPSRTSAVRPVKIFRGHRVLGIG